jgi:hypothetical protein
MGQWGISADVLPTETAELQGLWRETPPLWHLPPLEIGEASPDVLTALAAQLVGQAAVVHDVTTERFLAVANAVARQDPKAARMSLRGLRYKDPLFYFARCWAKGEEPCYGFDREGGNDDGRTAVEPLLARDHAVVSHLGALPCLLWLQAEL